MYCIVVTASKSVGIGNGLTYLWNGEEMTSGLPVRVPLRNKLVEGLVIEVKQEKSEQYDVKQITELLGSKPLLTEAQLKTVRWMADYYMTTLRQALSVWLPPPPWSRVLPDDLIGFRSAGKDDSGLRSKKQRAILRYLWGKKWVDRDELMREVGASPSVLRTLKENGFITEEKRRATVQDAEFKAPPIKTLPTLTPAQEAAYDLILNDKRPSLLFGVTGSGKTEIYAQLIADAVRDGKQSLLLVPEILLTEHSIQRFEQLLHRDAISVIHSKLTGSERRHEWKRIARGEVALVIGSRSALFSPLKKLGVIILDEEHEWTYKNEQMPRYHARDTAEVLARHSDAKLLFGSATPSLESWARTKSGQYQLVKLSLRYREQPLPKVRIIDLAAVQFGSLYPFSTPLLEAISDRLKRKEQSVLFLNRRGVASAILCMQCRRRIICPASQLPFTVHHTSRGRPFLLDHVSGLIAEVPTACPNCKSVDLKAIGAGTQKIEMILKMQFPEARLIRADSDTLQDPLEMRSLLSKMRNQEADILLGTQSVVKGLDLPNVTLAAVILADLGLSLPHFRAGERVFQLLTQLTGRSGRAKDGEVIIQTFRPEAPEIIAASKHDTEKYLSNELKLRIYAGYPPASKMVRVIMRGDDAEKRARAFHAKALSVAASERSDVMVSVAPTVFGGGKIWHVLLRGGEPKALLSHIDINDLIVDIDPMETM